MNILRFILSLLKWAVLAVLTLLAIYVINSNFNIIKGYKTFLVQSGSMEPAIMTGDVILIKQQKDYLINDVVTFSNNSGRVVTHRIQEIDKSGEKKYFTKGDANKTGDEDHIVKEQIMGKAILVVPRLGYLLSFAKTLNGLIILLIIPAFIYVLDELVKIKNAKKSS
ncbi:MAG: signal peptidase I [Candidatus Pacebacteria bacterium]|nr:signal peptidase I [Candidatus Paceibacterota bacterium]